MEDLGNWAAKLRRPVERPPIWESFQTLRPDPDSSLILNSAWEYSRNRLLELQQALQGIDLDGVMTVAVAGSLARMEAHPTSDLDLVVILETDVPNDSAVRKSAFERIEKAVEALGFSRSQPGGIFSEATYYSELLDPSSIGRLDEGYRPYGIRMGFLLEFQPVLGVEAFFKIQQAIVDRFATGYVECDSRKEFTYLLNELLRYFRSLFLTYQWGYRGSLLEFQSRNLKGMHCRLWMFAGLLFLLGESSRWSSGKVPFLKSLLPMVPLERMLYVYSQYHEAPWNEFLQGAARYLNEVRSSDFLDRLGSSGELFQSLHANGENLRREIVRAILENRGHWSERFLELLIL